MHKNRIYSNSIVAIQAVCGVYLAVSVVFEHLLYLPLFLVITGSVLGLYAILTMRLNNFNVIPEIKKNAMLVTSGPYNIIRHPMYTGLLILCTGLLITNITPFRVSMYIILLIDLVVKLRYEEFLLVKYFKEYAQYQKKTFRLIPYIY